MTTYNYIQQYKKSFVEFVDPSRFANPLAVTLTLKQGIPHYVSSTSTFARITVDIASRNFRHFMNLLNSAVYGKRFKRHHVRLQAVPILEGNGITRLHYHCIIDRPDEVSHSDFSSLIRCCWSQTDWGYDQIDIQPMHDAGWTKYISKLRGKLQFDESFDWSNTHLTDRRV